MSYMYNVTHWLVASTSRGVLPVYVYTGVSVINVCTYITFVSFHIKLCRYYILLYLYMYNAF
jgi:hypothetical protein